MTAEVDRVRRGTVPVEPSPPPESDAEEAGSLRVLTGRMVSLRFFLAVLRRTRWIWLAAAMIGLVGGALYHVIVPVKYSATATLYLAHPSGTASTVEAQDDLAILQTPTVAEDAIHRLGKAGRGLTPTALLGKAPATVNSGNVFTLDLSGPTPAAAVRRVNALTSAFLAFRAQLYEQQNSAVTAATNHQIATLQAQVNSIDAQIAQLTTSTSGTQLASLQAQRGRATSSINNLQQAIQQANLDTLSVVHASRVLTPGTLVPTSRKKVLAFDGITGMVGAGGVAICVILVLAVLSDRLRRREDLATLLGAPVPVSVTRPPRRGFRRPSLQALVVRREPALQVLVHHFASLLAGGQRTLLVVPADDARIPGAALLSAAARLSAEGRRVALVDETRDRALGRAFGLAGTGATAVEVGSAPPVSLVVPPKPWEREEGAEQPLDPERADDEVLPELEGVETVLVLASVDPAVGAWHLRRWRAGAVLCVTAGRSTTQRVTAQAELLSTAGIALPSAVLLGADPHDESVGLPVTETPVLERRLAMLHPSPALST